MGRASYGTYQEGAARSLNTLGIAKASPTSCSQRDDESFFPFVFVACVDGLDQSFFQAREGKGGSEWYPIGLVHRRGG